MMPDPRLNGQMYVYKALSGPVEKAKSYDPKREFKVGYSTWIEFFCFYNSHQVNKKGEGGVTLTWMKDLEGTLGPCLYIRVFESIKTPYM